MMFLFFSPLSSYFQIWWVGEAFIEVKLVRQGKILKESQFLFDLENQLEEEGGLQLEVSSVRDG